MEPPYANMCSPSLVWMMGTRDVDVDMTQQYVHCRLFICVDFTCLMLIVSRRPLLMLRLVETKRRLPGHLMSGCLGYDTDFFSEGHSLLWLLYLSRCHMLLWQGYRRLLQFLCEGNYCNYAMQMLPLTTVFLSYHTWRKYRVCFSYFTHCTDAC